jgi:hypothetical protein
MSGSSANMIKDNSQFDTKTIIKPATKIQDAPGRCGFLSFKAVLGAKPSP